MFEKTKAIYQKMIHDIDIAIHVADIIFQILFLGFYTYNGVVAFNENRLILFYLYVSLFALGVIWLLVTIFRYKFEKKQKRKIGRIVKYIKWSIRAVVIGINIYFAIRYGASDLRIILIVLSIIFLIGQIVFELICNFVRNYYEMLLYSIMQDVDKFVDDVPGAVKFFDKSVFKTNITGKLKEVAAKHKNNEEAKDRVNKIKNKK